MFQTEEQLDDRLTTPSGTLTGDLRNSRGDIVVLGAGGKMGPTLCRLARRGLDAAGRAGDRVFAVSRWSNAAAAHALSEDKIDTVPFDLLGEQDLAELPDAPNVVFMVGAKFGTATRPDLAWAVNTTLPDRVARRYPHARIVALSTGNIYPFVPVTSGGSRETDTPMPVGDYAMSCLGRERVLSYAAATRGTAVALLRLNYAVDLRYGVLADIGQAVLAGEPVDIRTPLVNVVWQGYANEVILRALGHAAPEPFVLNLTGPETASVRRVATRFAERFGVESTFAGEEGPTALLSDAQRCHQLFGYPAVSLGTLIDWQADWLAAGLPTLGKPTKFTSRDGKF
jgi:dTDP-4-dehydrorhamnose reductase